MSVLAIDDLPDFRAFAPTRAVYHCGDRRVPHPANLAPLLRPEHPDAHWASVLGYIFDAHDGLNRDVFMLRCLLERNCTDPRAARYVLRLVPIAPCRHCGKRFLREALRKLHCSDRCRRLDCALPPTTDVRIPRLSACARCGGALSGRRRWYCGEDCEREARNARYRERRATGERGGPSRAPAARQACAVCGGTVGGRRRRYCGGRCERAARNATRARTRPSRAKGKGDGDAI